MRIIAIAGFFLAALLGCAAALNASEAGWVVNGGAGFQSGMGTVAGSTGTQAVYIQGTEPATRYKYTVGTLQRQIPAAALRGQRVRVSLRMKSEGITSTQVALLVWRPDRSAIHAPASYNWQTDNGAAWRVKTFVVDVPADAEKLTLNVNVRDTSKVWVDELKLDAVGQDVALTSSRRSWPEGESLRQPVGWEASTRGTTPNDPQHR